MNSSFLIALGSNQRHVRYGVPRFVIRAAMEELACLGTVKACSSVITSAPIGPAQRQFANAACVVESDRSPPELLVGLKQIERAFGRRRGQIWGDRVLDLDIALWTEGVFTSRVLTIPHREMIKRRFVLEPAAMIAPGWRDPVKGLSITHLASRAAKPIPARNARHQK